MRSSVISFSNQRETELCFRPTYSASSAGFGWTRMDLYMKSGAHNASAPVTNDTQVNAADDSMKLLLQNKGKNNITIHVCGKPGKITDVESFTFNKSRNSDATDLWH